MNYTPDTEGIDHINVYSKSKTVLGRLLTNFAETPFEHPKYGTVNSMEGFWYFCKLGKIYPELLKTSGYLAKQKGKSLYPKIDSNDKIIISEEFKEEILEGIRLKLRQNKDILIKLISTDLPLSHYYAYGNKSVGFKVHYLPEYDWQIQEIERIRAVSKEWYIKKYGELPKMDIEFFDEEKKTIKNNRSIKIK